MKIYYIKSDRIIILFDRAVEYVCSRGIEKNKVLYIPNGVSLDKYRDLRIDKSIKNLFPIEKNIVIYTGSHGIANDLYPLIETAKILTKKNNKIHFVLVGNGPLKEKLKSMAKEHRLKNITFLDPVPKDKIPLILSFADLSFISIKNSPLYKWGFSMNKLYDYMAAGLPIMIHSSKEVLGELIHVNGIKLAENPNELASKIIEIIDDKEYKKHAGNNLRQFVETNYSWEKLVVNLEESMILDLRERDSQVEKSI